MPRRRGDRRYQHRGVSGWLLRILVALISIVAALSIGEVAVRTLNAAPPLKQIALDGDDTVYRRSTNPILGFELKANYRDENANLKRSYPRTNAHGQRDIERTIAKPAGVKRVILLGDSVVEGFGIREIDDTMSRQIERLHPDGTMAVLNFGVSAYCTRAEVELLEVKGLAFQPDVVILLFVGNDFDNFNREAFVLGGARERPEVVDRLFAGSHAFRMACLGLNLFHYRADADPVSWNQQAIGDNNVVEGLRRLRFLSDRHGFATVIAIWPSFLDDRIQDVHTMSGGDDGPLVIERLAQSMGMPTVRLSEPFRRHRESTDSSANPRLRYTLGDRMHPSVEGCRIAAESLYAALADLPAHRSPGDEDRDAVKAAMTLGTKMPDYAVVYTSVADDLSAAGRFEQARKYYEMALGEDPDYAVAHNNLGMMLTASGSADEAIGHYRQAIAADPDFDLAHNNLGNALRSLDRLGEAARHYRRALDLQPGRAETHFNLGNVLATQGKFDDALGHFREALRISPDMAEAQTNLGNALQSLGRLEEAIRHYREALKVDSESAKTHFGLGFALETKGELSAAIGHYRRALAIQPDFDDARRSLDSAIRQQAQSESLRRTD